MSREGRLGFPRPFGDILRKYRPLIPNVPQNVSKIASVIDDEVASNVNVVEATEGIYTIDFSLNIKGADEFSKSSLQFTSDGDFLGGTVRAGIVSLEGGDSPQQIERDWERLLFQDVNLDRQKDDVEIMMRQNFFESKGVETITPHVIFTSTSPAVNMEFSPVKTNELIEILRRIQASWEDRFDKYPLTARVVSRESEIELTEGEETVEDDDIEDMMDFLTTRLNLWGKF